MKNRGHDIGQSLKQQGMPLSAAAVRDLAAEDFVPLLRRLDRRHASNATVSGGGLLV